MPWYLYEYEANVRQYITSKLVKYKYIGLVTKHNGVVIGG